MIKIVAIPGSLRKGSYNAALLQAAQTLLPEDTSIEVLRIDDVEHYNGDVEAQGFPRAVVRLRQQIHAADAVLIATPEYNYSIPGVLKNAIDWISRPPDQPFKGKALGIIGAATGMLGSARAQYHLRQVAVTLDMHAVNKPEVLVAMAKEKFDLDLNLTDERARINLQKLLAELVNLAKKLKQTV